MRKGDWGWEEGGGGGVGENRCIKSVFLEMCHRVDWKIYVLPREDKGEREGIPHTRPIP